MPDIKGAGEGAATKGKGALTHKVGPLPLWGWAVAGIAAVIVAKKFTGGGGGGSAPGSFGIPSIGSGAGAGSFDGGPSIVNPSQNARAGTDTAIGTPTPPWWAGGGNNGSGQLIDMIGPFERNQMRNVAGLTPFAPPSTNGSAGAGPANTTPTGDSTPKASWFTKLLNPSGGMPAGASVTSIGGTVYSLSSDALARAGIAGAVPVANAAPAASTTSSTALPAIPAGWTGNAGGGRDAWGNLPSAYVAGPTKPSGPARNSSGYTQADLDA